MKRIPEGKVVDLLVRVLTEGESEYGCRMSEEFKATDCVAAALRACGAGGGREVKEMLVEELNASRTVDYAVFLATDGVYRNDRFVAEESHLVIPNTYVKDIARRNARVFFGASVHPYREPKEMMAETSRCIDEGALLFNWVPSIQRIDPEDDRCIPFYLRIAQEGIPLLCHSGHPYSAVRSAHVNMDYDNPRKLRRALDIGVKVIVSRCGSRLDGRRPTSDIEYGDELVHMLGTAEKNGWDLYASTGTLSFERAREDIFRGDTGAARFLFGSGVPLSGHEGRISGDGNLFDRNYRSLRAAGIPEPIFIHAGDVIGSRSAEERVTSARS